MQLETRPVESLVPYANNARVHSDSQVSQIARSIREFGFNNPVLIDENGGIIAGHGRVMAANELGMSKVPVIVLAHLSESQKRAYILADNKIQLSATWDIDKLSDELQALVDQDFGLEAIGFSDAELDAILKGEAVSTPEVLSAPSDSSEDEAATGDDPELGEDEDEIEVKEGLTDDDAVPDPAPDTVSKPGDVWWLGPHKVVCGDSSDMDSALNLMGNSKADMVFSSMAFTDPPWNVGYGEHNGRRTITNDNLKEDDWQQFVLDFSGTLFAVTNPGAPIYLVMGSQEWPIVDKTLRDIGFHWSSTIVWVKDQFVLTRKDYHAQFEPIWYGWNSRAARLVEVEDRSQSDVWQFPRPKVSELHPTTKPVELVMKAIKNSSKPDAIVVDLFGGSGTTLIACEKLGRVARIMECEAKYVDVIVKRWQDFTGQKAVHAQTGKSFDELKN